MNTNDRYNQLTRGKSASLNVTPQAFLPSPTDTDYKRSYVYRYFVQKANDDSSPIYEVSDNEYRKLSSSPLYNTTYLKWRLSGPLVETKIGAGEVIDYGVQHSNKISIKLASNTITKLGLYLPNLKQFHK